jgi:hypothetical protein
MKHSLAGPERDEDFGWVLHHQITRASERANPQPNPQIEMSCTTSANFGSPRGLVSRCKICQGNFDTVEVRSSSLLVLPFLFCG